MTWNYRIVEKIEDDGYTYQGIYEVYYTDGEPTTVSQEAIPIVWTIGENTHHILMQVQEAFSHPVLYFDDLNKEVF